MEESQAKGLLDTRCRVGSRSSGGVGTAPARSSWWARGFRLRVRGRSRVRGLRVTLMNSALDAVGLPGYGPDVAGARGWAEIEETMAALPAVLRGVWLDAAAVPDDGAAFSPWTGVRSASRRSAPWSAFRA